MCYFKILKDDTVMIKMFILPSIYWKLDNFFVIIKNSW